ncbi:MAG: M1 family peptidase [Nocardioidaceae bacterium]|nr:M1 family peptidase [Nocardioidaceae bacterium]
MELTAGKSQPVEDPFYPDTSNPEIDVLHYFLDLSWDGQTLTGTTTATFRTTTATDTVRLDLAAALTVDNVELDARPVSFEQADDGLVMHGQQMARGVRHTLTISYRGEPVSTPAPSRRLDSTEGLGWNTDRDGNVYTFQEPFGAFTWYPVNDHPSDEALYDARIHTRGADVGVFNGKLTGRARAGGETVTNWHVDEPMASYLTTIAIGPYRRHTGITNSGMEISYWLMPRDTDLLPTLKREGATAFEWLEGHAGDYPFSTLGVVVVGGTSAMETQTLVTMSRGAAERPDAVLQHELSHQWYGDAVTPVDWRGLWLSEGFAMYFQQWYEGDLGRPMYAGGVDEWRGYDNQARQQSGPPGDYDPQSFGDLNVYLGPAMMLNEIRKQVGDQAFERLVKTWVTDHDNGHVDRLTFTRYVNVETGRDFTSLIDRWLDSPRTPRPS